MYNVTTLEKVIKGGAMEFWEIEIDENPKYVM